jgi:hypothetical protein
MEFFLHSSTHRAGFQFGLITEWQPGWRRGLWLYEGYEPWWGCGILTRGNISHHNVTSEATLSTHAPSTPISFVFLVKSKKLEHNREVISVLQLVCTCFSSEHRLSKPNSTKQQLWATIEFVGRNSFVLYLYNVIHEGFRILTAVTTKAVMLWDITPCSPAEVHRRFGGTYFRLHAIYFSPGSNCFSLSHFQACIQGIITLQTWWWTMHVSPKGQWNSIGILNVTSQKIELMNVVHACVTQSVLYMTSEIPVVLKSESYKNKTIQWKEKNSTAFMWRPFKYYVT